MGTARRQHIITGLTVLTLATLALAHSDDERGGEHNMHTDHPVPVSNATGGDKASYYFAYEPHKGWLYLHILTMVVAWVFVMPIATMLSIAGSRYHLPTQVVFLIANGAGVVFSTLYNSLTPDLYPANAHHRLGWVLACTLGVQAALGVAGTVIRRAVPFDWRSKEEHSGFMAVPMHSPVDSDGADAYRPSGDSGHSMSMEQEFVHDDLEGREWSSAVEENSARGRVSLSLARAEEFLSKRAPFIFNQQVVRICDFVYSAIARLLIPLGFVQISLGIVTGSGIFMGNNVFNGLAHFIKGGIFFLYGILTLGRWLGAFADLGWAWNTKPKSDLTSGRKWTPTAETVESGLIFIYGCSNVFLEHLASWGGAWSHSDLQHISIAFMFFGGGLAGLLIESRKIGDLLDRTIVTNLARPSVTTSYGVNVVPAEAQPPTSHRFSYNPLPAMVIFLLGILMSQHHQHSKLSTMIHMQWGYLLAGSAIFRLVTYMLFYRSPPTSIIPSRPPTEIVAAFCLIAGGLVFMTSNKNTVAYMDKSGLDAMFSLTVTVGITALLMSWITTVMAIKGWALKKEQGQFFKITSESNA